MLSPDTVAVARPGAVWSDVESDVVILDTEQGKYFSTGPVGALVWRLIETPCSVEQLCDAVTAEFDVDASTASTDVGAFVESLLASGLAQPAPTT